MSNPNPSPSPASGPGAVLSIVQAVIGLVPRWLVVAAGIIAVTFMGAEAYLTIRGQWAATRESEAKSSSATGCTLPTSYLKAAAQAMREGKPAPTPPPCDGN